MHSFIREHLQSHLYAYKHPVKEQGIPLLQDASEEHEARKRQEERDATEKLEIAKVPRPYKANAQHMKVGFAVRANINYDGALDRRSPLIQHTVSFKKGQFMHIHARYSPEWWIGRIVEKNTRLGFIPTAKRIGKLEKIIEDDRSKRTKKETKKFGQPSSIWECTAPFTVVPSTRPVVFIGPAFHGSQVRPTHPFRSRR